MGFFIGLFFLMSQLLTCIETQDDTNTYNPPHYNEVALTFQSDYDRDNPLTARMGDVRFLNLQIDEAHKTGNTE